MSVRYISSESIEPIQDQEREISKKLGLFPRVDNRTKKTFTKSIFGFILTRISEIVY